MRLTPIAPRRGVLALPRFFCEVLAVVVVVLLAAAVPGRAGPALERAMDAVFVVKAADAGGRFLGSAFQMGDVVVTAAHVVGEARAVVLVDRAGRVTERAVLARDAVRDVAVIAGEPGVAGLRSGVVPGLGEAVYALGAPLGAEFSLTRGVVSAAARQVEPAVPLALVQHDAAVNPGGSGGPLVDEAGRLVGMNTRIADGSRMFVGIAYAIGVGDVQRIVAGLRAGNTPVFPHLGLRARDVEGRVAVALGLIARGVLVDAVEQGSLAEVGGLRGGDVILAVDGAVIGRAGDMAFAVEAALARGEMDVAVLRGGAAILVTVGLVPVASGLETGGGAPEVRQAYDLAALGVEIGAGGEVMALTDNSPGMFAGLVVGDRVLAVNGRALDGAALRALRIEAAALVLVQNEAGTTRHLFLDPWGAAEAGWRPVGGANVLDPAVVVF